MEDRKKFKWVLILMVVISPASNCVMAEDEQSSPIKNFDSWWEEIHSIEKAIEDCEATVRSLISSSETMDRAGDSASERTQLMFRNDLNGVDPL